MNQTSQQFRILAVSLSSRGFGYAVMEGDNALILYGKMIINKDKNARSLAHIDKLIARNAPDDEDFSNGVAKCSALQPERNKTGNGRVAGKAISRRPCFTHTDKKEGVDK